MTKGVPASVLAKRYQLAALIGTGAVGSVYRALDLELDEVVALKMIRPGAAASWQRTFHDEVKLARRVTHRNVARMFDIGEHEGERFLTMEYVDGASLRQIIAGSTISVSRALRIAGAIAEALVAAHSAGILHRDLKPANVLVESSGRVVVTDFGLACCARTAAAGGTPNPGAGTPIYMAPEQLLGKDDLDERVDLYALGEILFELLVGRRVWATPNTYEDAAVRLRQAPPDPCTLQPNVGARIGALVTRLLARDRNERPATAAEAVELLKDAAGDTRAIRGSRTDPRRVGQELKVDAVVHGAMRGQGEDGFALDLRLVSVGDGFQLWEGTFETKRTGLFLTCDAAARAIGEALATRVCPAPRASAMDPLALDLYLRARQELVTKAYGQDVERAVALLELALARQPDDANLLAAYAVAASRIGHTAEAAARALVAARRATALAPHIADTWLALANVLYMCGDLAGTVRACGEALSRSPHQAKAHHIVAELMYQVGWTDGAIRTASLALALDPSLQGPAMTLAVIHALTGDTPRALQMLDHPSVRPEPVRTIAEATRSRIEMWSGKRAVPRSLEGPGPTGAVVRFIHDVAASHAIAPDSFKDFRAQRSLASQMIRAFMGQLEAEAWALVGDPERTIEALDFADGAGLADALWLDCMPLLATLRERPRFAAIRASVGARAEALRLVLEHEGFSN